MFADPISDTAVLICPDGQELHDNAVAWDEFVKNRFAFCVAATPAENFAGFILTLKNKWSPCRIVHYGPRLEIHEAVSGIEGGMSGSPILDENANAVGIVSVSSNQDSFFGQPCLYETLPGWLARYFQKQGEERNNSCCPSPA